MTEREAADRIKRLEERVEYLLRRLAIAEEQNKRNSESNRSVVVKP